MTIHERSMKFNRDDFNGEETIQSYLRAFLSDSELVEKVAVEIYKTHPEFNNLEASFRRQKYRNYAIATLSVIRQEAGIE